MIRIAPQMFAELICWIIFNWFFPNGS